MTPRQRDMLLVIRRYFNQNGCSPNYDEIAEGMGLKSKSSVCKVVVALEERGYLSRDGGRFSKRAIVLTREGERVAAAASNRREPELVA